MLRIERVSKRYRIGRAAARHDTLREALTQAVARSLRALAGRSREPDASFLALRDVSFEVGRGEVLGIIGRNGAGKSTLLKVLSRITEPTSGRVEAYGRVGSLLEVGTGFHPDLTGRENIYLNGSILGMRRAEVARKFDRIVDFSGVEAFLDTPVKRYSSGMYVRLAFAVAAHLDPEILVIDEVLAVGDIEFQRRCLEKMEAVARDGRTVLLVTHNVGTVQTFCSRAILLRDGAIAASGDPGETVRAYLSGLERAASDDLRTRTDRAGAGHTRLTRCEVWRDGVAGSVLTTGQPASFVFDVSDVRPGLVCLFTLYDQLGRPVTHFSTALEGPDDLAVSGSPARFRCDVDELLLMPGRYRINAAVALRSELHDHVEGAAVFDVEEGLIRGRRVPQGPGMGDALMPHRWTLPA
jgi:lipopolysaccharide transport system ATP-binding protein